MANQEDSSGLPLLKKERVMQILTKYVIPGAVGVVLVTKFMPAINNALSLLIDGTWKFAELGLAFGITVVALFAFMSLWPAYKRFMESVAHKATWAVFEWDPITPMELRIEEVERDDQALQRAYTNVDGVIAKNEKRITDLRTASSDAQSRFNVAVNKFGKDSRQASLASIDVGTPNETANSIEEDTKALRLLREMLKEICDASEFTLKQAKAQMEGARTQWEAALANESAFAAGFRVLRGKSERSANADKSMEIIRNRFGSSFGRVRALRQLSDQMLNEVVLQQGVFHQEAYDNFKQQTRLLTGKEVASTDVIPMSVPQPERISLYR